MGFFGTYLYDGRGWAEHDVQQAVELPVPSLLVDIHDSDIATIRYRPTYDGSGVVYLGHTPRMYFEEEDASVRTDTTREAAALAAWWGEHGTGGDVMAKQAEILTYLAEDLDTFDDVEDLDEDEEDLDDARSLSRSRPQGSCGLSVFLFRRTSTTNRVLRWLLLRPGGRRGPERLRRRGWRVGWARYRVWWRLG